MAVISLADLNYTLDSVGSAYLRGLGTSGSGFGIPSTDKTYGFMDGALKVKTTVANTADLDISGALGPGILRSIKLADGPTLMASIWMPFLAALQAHLIGAGLSGVTGFDSYLKYYNTGSGGTWTALVSGRARKLFELWLGSSQALSAVNFYADVYRNGTNMDGTAAPNALLSGTIGSPGTITPSTGVTIDSTLYAGGVPQVTTISITGSGLVTVTGTARDPSTGTTVANATWTATLAAGSSTVALSPGGSNPAPANSLILSASALAVAVGLTGGQIFVESARPAGRSALPL